MSFIEPGERVERDLELEVAGLPYRGRHDAVREGTSCVAAGKSHPNAAGDQTPPASEIEGQSFRRVRRGSGPHRRQGASEADHAAEPILSRNASSETVTLT